jgi:enoyl-CoA hydratase/carnithine racemase
MICCGGPNAIKQSKQLVLQLSKANDTQEQHTITRSAFQSMIQSEEAGFGMMAFVQKQVVDWSKL